MVDLYTASISFVVALLYKNLQYLPAAIVQIHLQYFLLVKHRAGDLYLCSCTADTFSAAPLTSVLYNAKLLYVFSGKLTLVMVGYPL